MLGVMVPFFLRCTVLLPEGKLKRTNEKNTELFSCGDRYMIKSREGQKISFFVPRGGREGGKSSSFQ